ncbi:MULTISPECIES: TetR/AcrR family transcriptional regulator [Mycolicibacter]|uniref:TetR/AcrR family transcriptional regulator n=1 Tax=Mycolicibacter virginiensis TaxID=1795032 RepID=A0A9X7NZR0_9MYCO|nr:MULTISPECIES: TetR/AcrR family transcriptional regulator [Mycobacteriaceae]OBG40890.1 TetR family transcriptional regulator [Mycolicibacter heraklionensis]OBJ30833.1 TetR family transcriptional regulator [Mycolicibacter heraklionensis]PQM53363.1 TetR/AcrR family transcriptional regulator [Mycolicibacter virginiensis]ULP49768.1 TetR/AcrR family transcriptional regulator [Mycolicibacter virginiensis]
MAGRAWLSDQRGELAAEKILDAAEKLFAEQDPSSVGMTEIARAAGCSRATLYRYFESRDALHTAYVHRWANALYEELTRRLAGIDDPADRLVAGITESLALVRGNPALVSWFAETGPPIGAAMAAQSDVITVMVASFLSALDTEDNDAVAQRARWVVRVVTSMLSFPGRDADDEREMLTQFVVPVVVAPERLRPAPVGSEE